RKKYFHHSTAGRYRGEPAGAVGVWLGLALLQVRPVPLQVRKAVEALLAFSKSKAKGDELLLNESDCLHLLVTVWKIPRVEPLPHSIRTETAEICLFTKDEPNLSAEQTENLYKKLLTQNGITNVSQVISYKTLKKEYKPFEAKRRLLNRFDLFLSDDRIRRLLPSHIGKHFYERKKAPLCVNLKAKNLAKEFQKHIQGTTLPVTNKGCCYTARIGHTGMKADEIVDNIIAAAKVIDKKLPKNWKNVKVLHLKTLKSVALPIFTARISNLNELDRQPVVDRKEGEMFVIWKMEPNQSPVESDNLGKKTKATLGKRKKQPLDAEAPKPKHADVQMSPKQKKAKQPSMPKEAIKEKELKKTPKKPEAKSFATPKAGKLVQSGKKPSKTPKQTPKKVGRPQSA
uniref:Ribosomal L1 domain-containing protein 1 n=1 Tax=Anas platyrhynchos platyrhynchos TaxID=8840 RepID=A0A493T8E0_ANAPP